jgi:hypothetical protein
MVKGRLPTVRKPDENPPPRNESNLAGYHNVFLKQLSTSFLVISQKGFTAGFPKCDWHPVKSREAAPELIRCITPPSANPLVL